MTDDQTDKDTNSRDIDLFQIFSEEQQKKLTKFIEVTRESSRDVIAQTVYARSQIGPTIGLMKDQLAEMAFKITQLAGQYRAAIQNGINNFDNPENYDPSNVWICPWTLGFSTSQGIEMHEDIKNSHFDYLADRYSEGLDAYILRDFQKAIFTFLSCLDGILKEFCEQHKSTGCQYSGDFPSFKIARTHFMSYYKLEFAADDAHFQDRLKEFFDHRNQIMHGDRYAYFDENIATISLLFLGLVFYTVKDEI